MAVYQSARLLLLLLLSCSCCGGGGLVSLGAAALSFDYNFSVPGDLDRAGLKCIGDCFSSTDRIDVTYRDKLNSSGRVFYPQPVRLWDRRTNSTASFNTSFTFAINSGGGGGGNSTTRPRGDGMAFFIGPFPPSLPADSFGSCLGLFNDSSLNSDNATSLPPTVAVEFDTYWNKRWDPQDSDADHVGIDVNTMRSRSFTTGLRKGDLAGTMSASIAYNGSSKLMVVSLRLANGTSTHPIQATVDLIGDARLPSDAAIGFSAATGADVESHQLLSWSFSSTDPTISSSSKIQLWVIISLSAAALLACMLAALLCAILRLRRQRRRAIVIELQVARKFSYHELSAATKNFSEDRKLGAGAFGQVYRGDLLGDPRMPPVAVKRLTRMMEQTRKDYVTEVMTLGRLSHRNLVRLVGWCDDGGGASNDAAELLLVYELVTQGSLEKHLHGRDRRLLTWAERFKIVLDIGYAVEYLHTGCANPILHRDIKPSNVMLEEGFVAKLGDFGLVRQVPTQGSLAGTTMVGSIDYIDPVCISNSTVSTASDMYSFGVLLLEMATGKDPAVMRQESGRPYALVETVQESYRGGTLLEMADERLDGNYEEWQMERVLAVGLLCVQHDRQDRPTIKKAVAILSDQAHTVPLVRLPKYSPTN